MKLLKKKGCPWEGQPQCPFLKDTATTHFISITRIKTKPKPIMKCVITKICC